jgi:hypothetical protein
MWVMAVVGVAPCQCFSPGGIQTTSPGTRGAVPFLRKLGTTLLPEGEGGFAQPSDFQ